MFLHQQNLLCLYTLSQISSVQRIQMEDKLASWSMEKPDFLLFHKIGQGFCRIKIASIIRFYLNSPNLEVFFVNILLSSFDIFYESLIQCKSMFY